MEPYPQLRRYLDSAIVADRVRALRYPDEWVRWTSLVVIVVLACSGYVWQMLVVAIVSSALQYVVQRRRLGTGRRQDILWRALEQNLPKTLKRALKKGRIQEELSQAHLESLERCATVTSEIVADRVEAVMLRGERPRKSAFGDTVDALMRAALRTTFRPHMMHVAPRPDELASLDEIESQLRAFRNLTLAEHSNDENLEALLAKAKALAEIHQTTGQGEP